MADRDGAKRLDAACTQTLRFDLVDAHRVGRIFEQALAIKMDSALNRAVDEGMAVFDEPLLGQSGLDRFRHQAHQLVLDGESYRKRTSPAARIARTSDQGVTTDRASRTI